MPDPSRILQRCDALARHSELPGGLTRVFLSPQARAAADLVLGWMREAGMQARLDAIGNAVGRYEGERPGLACLMLGSHLDTVRDAGKYDGMLGVVAAIECVDALHRAGKRLPFAIEVVGFGDEEGVRFGTTLLGSRAIAGTLDPALLETRDAQGISIREALIAFGLEPRQIEFLKRKPGEVLAYVELHIEQGPVLEAEGLAVGVVSAINGFSRLRVTLRGELARNAQRRGLACAVETLQELGSSRCAPWLMAQLERAVQDEGLPVLRLPSGAGHDGMALKAIADIAMLFVRCKGGISHNPAEAISEEDAATGARVLYKFIHGFRPQLSA
jgi:acetylornithine deacetylase/succinyl-diaminopimelate desuccinylase-like protein